MITNQKGMKGCKEQNRDLPKDLVSTNKLFLTLFQSLFFCSFENMSITKTSLKLVVTAMFVKSAPEYGKCKCWAAGQEWLCVH